NPENPRFYTGDCSWRHFRRGVPDRSRRRRDRLFVGCAGVWHDSTYGSAFHSRDKDTGRHTADCRAEPLGGAVDGPDQCSGTCSQRLPDLHTRFTAAHWIATMAIPIVYNLRNLVVRKTTTLMTALGIALTVAVLVTDVALVRGLRAVLERSG